MNNISIVNQELCVIKKWGTKCELKCRFGEKKSAAVITQSSWPKSEYKTNCFKGEQFPVTWFIYVWMYICTMRKDWTNILILLQPF